MTYEEAKKKRIEFLKIDIRNRLHKLNPDKYPKVKSYSAVEAWEIAHTLVLQSPSFKDPFNSDSVFYKYLNKK